MKCDVECSEILLLVFKVLTSLLGLSATVVILKLCSNHLKNFNNPLFQRKIIGNISLETGLISSSDCPDCASILHQCCSGLNFGGGLRPE